MELSSSPLYYDIKKILDNKQIKDRIKYTGILHTDDTDLDIVKIVDIDFNDDFVNNITTEIFISCVIPKGTYIKLIYPYRNNLELSITKTELSTPEYIINEVRYKAVFLEQSNPVFNIHDSDDLDEDTLNLSDILKVKFQLVPLFVEPITVKTTDGIYNNIKPVHLLRSVIDRECKDVKILGERSLNRIDIYPPDNEEEMKHIILPSETKLISLPSMIQERFHGIYNAGLGSYLKEYNDYRTWFIYPLYNTKRTEDNNKKVIFYHLPINRYKGIENTYLDGEDSLQILATSEKKYNDNKQSSGRPDGVGFKMTHGSTIMKKPVEMTVDGPVMHRDDINTEVALHESPDQLTYALHGDRRIANNHFAQSSRVLAAHGGRLDLIWENSDPDLIYPGMACEYNNVIEKEITVVKGIILSVHTPITSDSNTLSSVSHQTNSIITIYTNYSKEKYLEHN